MELAILSDTHVPSEADGVPGWVRERVEVADYTIHAGDVDSPETFDLLLELTDGEFTAVAGEADPKSLGLPEVARVQFAEAEFVVVHGAGDREGYERRVVEAVRERATADAIGVAGHTHEPMDETVDGVRVLNPGSATGVSPASEPTMMTATIGAGGVEVRLHRD
jgi:putative phosphoesterase